jgi:hypothetical protein
LANSSRTDVIVAVICAVVLIAASVVLFAVGKLPVGQEGIADWPATLVVLGGVVMTIAVFSFLYKDNPVFRAAENLFVGVGLGVTLTIAWFQYLKPDIYDRLVAPALDPAVEVRHGDLILLVPIALGIMVLLRVSRSYGWVSRYPMAFLVGYGAGFGIQPTIHSNILKNMEYTIAPTPMHWAAWAVVGLAIVLLATTAYFASKAGRLATALRIASGLLAIAYVVARTTPALEGSAAVAKALASMDSIIILLGVFSVLCYFIFSLEHRGALGAVSRLGIVFLMVSFGASFGYTVMARESLLIGRFQFLLGDWLHLL